MESDASLFPAGGLYNAKADEFETWAQCVLNLCGFLGFSSSHVKKCRIMACRTDIAARRTLWF
jgi:hypothetical protein